MHGGFLDQWCLCNICNQVNKSMVQMLSKRVALDETYTALPVDPLHKQTIIYSVSCCFSRVLKLRFQCMFISLHYKQTYMCRYIDVCVCVCPNNHSFSSQLVASKFLNNKGEMEALTNTDFATIDFYL